MRQLTSFFARQAPALRGALATTLACELALVTVMALHLDNPAWALITVLVLATPTAGASIIKGVLRLIGTAVGAALGLMLIDVFDQMPLGFTIAFFLCCLVGAYGASGTRNTYAYFISLVTILTIAVGSLTTPYDAVPLAFSRASEVAIGVIIAALISLSLWPVRASGRLRAELADALEQCAALLAPAADAPAARDAAIMKLIAARAVQQTFLQASDGESDLTRLQHRRHRYALALLTALVDATMAAEAVVSAGGAALLRDERLAVSAAMRDLARALRLRRARGGASIAERLEALRIAAPTAADDAAGYRAALARALAAIAAPLAALARLSDFLGPGGGEAPAALDAIGRAATRRARQPWPDRPRLVHATKLAIVMVSVLWLWQIFYLPAGMQALVSALVITQRTVGATQRKGVMRLVGALMGGVAGILVASVALPGVGSLWVFCLLIAPLLFVWTWLNEGSPRYGYIGFQAAFAFVLTVVAGSSPEPNVMAAVLRVCGVLIGMAAATLIVSAIAPIDAWMETLRGIGRLLASLGRGWGTAEERARGVERRALRDQTAAYMNELPAGIVRRGWPTWPMDRLLALASRLAALAGLPGNETVTPALASATEQLSQAARRLGRAIATRRPTAETPELDQARAQIAAALPAADADALARIGILQTAASLLSRVERISNA